MNLMCPDARGVDVGAEPIVQVVAQQFNPLDFVPRPGGRRFPDAYSDSSQV